MWGRVGLAGGEGGGGGGQKDEEIGDGAREGGEGKGEEEGGRASGGGGAGGGAGSRTGGSTGGGTGAEGWKGSDLPPHQEMGQLSVQVIIVLYNVVNMVYIILPIMLELLMLMVEVIFESAGEKVLACCGKGGCRFNTKVGFFLEYLLGENVQTLQWGF